MKAVRVGYKAGYSLFIDMDCSTFRALVDASVCIEGVIYRGEVPALTVIGTMV